MGKKKGGGMTMNQMAGYLHIDVATMISGMQSIQVINQNLTPRKKYIDEGYFYEDGTIADYEGLKSLLAAKLGLSL